MSVLASARGDLLTIHCRLAAQVHHRCRSEEGPGREDWADRACALAVSSSRRARRLAAAVDADALEYELQREHERGRRSRCRWWWWCCCCCCEADCSRAQAAHEHLWECACGSDASVPGDYAAHAADVSLSYDGRPRQPRQPGLAHRTLACGIGIRLVAYDDCWRASLASAAEFHVQGAEAQPAQRRARPALLAGPEPGHAVCARRRALLHARGAPMDPQHDGAVPVLQDHRLRGPPARGCPRAAWILVQGALGPEDARAARALGH